MQPAKSPAAHAGLVKICAFFAIVLVGGALLAPVLFHAGKGLVRLAGDTTTQTGAVAWINGKIANAEFTRFFNRAVLVVALVAIWPFIRWAGFERAHFPRWQPPGSGLRQLGLGFALAALLLLTLGWVLCATGVYRLRSDANWLAFGGPLVAALSVGVVEEFFFRGALLGLLLRTLGGRAAMLWGTLVFALVHFLTPPEHFEIPDAEVAWHSGFHVIGAIFGHFGHMDFLLAEFCTLFAVGWVLARARLDTGRLWAGIGLHAGWVFGLKYFSALTRSSRPLNAGDYLPWIGVNLKIGLVPLLVVLLTGWLTLRLLRARGAPAA